MNQQHKVGIFGGSFDPFHYGHLNSMVTVAERLNLDRVKAVPSHRSPLRPQTQGATPIQRFEMCSRGIRESALIEVDQVELQRGGVSFTIDTLSELEKGEPGTRWYLIIGLDQFNQFDHWKDFEEILKKVDLVVVSRPGMEFPSSVERFPPGVRNFVEDHDGRQALLKNGHTIHFIKLQDVEASGTEIRRKIRLGQAVHHLIPSGVEDYIKEEGLYQSVAKDIGDFEAFTKFCAKHLIEKGGIQVKAFDLTKLSAPAEYTLITSGTSTRHATSLADSLVKEVKKQYGIWPQSLEGQTEGRWIVADYGALIIHSFYDFVRHEYRLEDLWKKGSEINL